ncbi:2-oxoisovalerate dehydrogenase E2 component [Glaciecola punicea ACAM 611]|uniref:Dihydrolipoamide acetyltransferase component of pyruvate dehydrogenase complex n=1 Tax=Glaciecola punicea ACAM 611 TaxID=1121923 RepID=H5T9Y4_9ALTE|nr:dihydrolipoyllysine-residue acetyltransferase [Glaciecola punicea]GAB55111.1 2-oxoisovalerate dehydrogenase E2 component [Glaciecola punicea ACAM 611]
MNDFILPDIGEGIVECELLKWLVAEGDTVVEDQPIAELMTDKATVEIPAMHNGIVSKLYYKEGDIARVHEPLFAMQSSSDERAETVELSPESEAQPIKATASGSAQIESFILPDIGEGIVECEIMQWLVSEGDVVSEDQAVVEVMTDKAVVEIPAKYNGKIVKLHYAKGDTAGVHTPLFDQEIDSGAQDLTNTSNTSASTAEPALHHSLKHPAVSSIAGIASDTNKHQQGEKYEPPVQVSRAIASPAVRRLAKENEISLSDIKPTGHKGRVLKQDVMQALSSHKEHSQASQNTQTAPNSAQTSGIEKASSNDDRIESIKGIRATMGKQMMASVSTIPHFSVSDELCMDKLIALRNDLKPVFEAESVKLSFLPFFIKALSLAMKTYPILNSRLNEAGTLLTYLSAHNIGIAVDSKIGLLVPNIKNVETLSLFDIAQQLNGIIERARLGKLSNAELSNGSISLSNIGAIGGITATPVINKPDVAIVALGKTQKLPRFTPIGDVFASNIMMVNWSGDHRVIDGATMVKFNNLWMDYLCHPEKMLVHLR